MAGAASYKCICTSTAERIYIYARPSNDVLTDRLRIPINLNIVQTSPQSLMGVSNIIHPLPYRHMGVPIQKKEVKWYPNNKPISRRQMKLNKNLSGR